ncbi:ATP-binding protein [Streptomyces sp. NPDC048255]|uniref:ATP-binding protein n=1 Tax=Streptomyces sp. NPDC048255 TaxID=3154713 RepID=UPI0033F060A6
MSRLAERGAYRREGLIATVAVAEYEDPARPGGRETLAHVEGVRGRVAELAGAQLGFGHRMRLDDAGTTRAGLWAGLDAFVAHRARRKILYWTGHGIDRGPAGYFLACRDTWAAGGFDGGRALAVTDLVDRLLDPADGADTLLVIDACSAHGHLPEALDRALSKEREAVGRAYRERAGGFVVVGTSGVGRVIPEGRWVEWLEQVIASPDLEMKDHARPLDPSALYLPVEYLLEGIDGAAAASGLDEPEERPGHVEVRSLPNSFLHNPYYADEGEVRGTALLGDDDPYPWLGAEHFGLEDGGELERTFSGRHGPLSRLVRWLETYQQGLLVVTGPAGCGKTALLGRLALMSVPRKCDRLDPPPPPQVRPRPGSVHALVSCRGQSLTTLTRALWELLTAFEGMAAPPAGTVTVQHTLAAIGALVAREGAVNLVFDGLDEAMPEQGHEIARHLLNPLSRSAGVKVVVGTRPQPRQQIAYREPDESLLQTLDRTAPSLVLDEDEETERDIADMVEAVLAAEGSPYAQPGAEAERTAAATRIAEESGRLFLIARLIAAELVRRPRRVPEDRLVEHIRAGGAGLRDRLADEIGHLSADGTLRTAELLRPLALVHGPGLSHEAAEDSRLWLGLANALRDDGTPELTARALRHVLTAATGSLVTGQPEPEAGTAWCLAHPSYGAYLLESAGLEPADGHRRLVDTLRAQGAGAWEQTHPYVRRYLGAHAAGAGSGLLELLFDDPDFLVHTDPDVMLPLTTAVLRDCEGAALYARVADEFRFRTTAGERRALLLATAFVSHRPGLYARLRARPGFASLPWRELWTDAPPEPLELRWPAPLGGARAMSWSAADRGRTLSVAGQGEIVVQDALTGKRLLTRRTTEERGGRREALTEVRELGTGAHRVTAARDSGAVHFWVGTERLPSQVYRWGGAPHSLTAVRCEDTALTVVADGRLTWAWRWPYQGRPGDGGLADVSDAAAGRIALLHLDGRSFLLLAGTEVTVRELHPKARGGSGLLGGSWVLREGGRPVYAAGALPDATGGGAWLAAADGQTVTVWRLTLTLGPDGTAPAGPRWGIPLTLVSKARGLALGRLGALPAIALHEGGAVRIRVLDEAALECSFPLRSQREPEALAFDPGGSGLVAAGDGPDVRLLDAASAVRAGRRARRRAHHERPVVALAAGPGEAALLCRAWGGEVLVGLTAGPDAGADPVVLPHEHAVTAVRALWDAGQWVVAVAAGRRTHLWRLAAGLGTYEQGEPLELGGDPGAKVPGIGLTAADGAVRLFVPVGGGVKCWTATGTHGREAGSAHAGILVCGLAARTMRDGSTWVVTDVGDRYRLWRATDDGLAAAGAAEVWQPTAPAVLGEYLVDGESIPLLAWAEGPLVQLAECTGRRWKRTTVQAGAPGPTALAFSGGPERPLLLTGGGERSLTVWDVRHGAWLPELTVPYRGMDVATLEAVFDEERGITLALQALQRCDLIRLSAALPARPTGRRRTARL